MHTYAGWVDLKPLQNSFNSKNPLKHDSPLAERVDVAGSLGRHQILGLLDQDHQDPPHFSPGVRVGGGVREARGVWAVGGTGDELQSHYDVSAINGHHGGRKGGGGAQTQLVSTWRLSLKK